MNFQQDFFDETIALGAAQETIFLSFELNEI
jgi:hypothetical protein